MSHVACIKGGSYRVKLLRASGSEKDDLLCKTLRSSMLSREMSVLSVSIPEGAASCVFSFLLQIFSIVVFGSIVNECYVNKDSQNPELLCIFNENESACSYGIAIGIIAFFGCIFFFVVDLHFQQISSVKDRKRVVLLDLGFSGFLSFLWFVAFCFLANQWQRTTMSKGVLQGADAARAAITFSFFSIIVWADSTQDVQ
ncbi:synaptogyrihypothetical protein [Limosa lapponica baueri]|uniref:MARVEL domain-containing protein n=1 Tax=Limosa lapponica baueri TaxID=1758121 RepID=A0A2I0TN39_LIMLA|nr:synaptogyrihypothetical protein [Limosa lapponica baueri]